MVRQRRRRTKSNELLSKSHSIIGLLFLIVFSVMTFGSVEHWSITIITILIMMVTAYQTYRNHWGAVAIPALSQMDRLILAGVLYAVLSTTVSSYLYGSLISTSMLLVYIAYYYLIRSQIKHTVHIQKILWIIVSLSFIYAIIGLLLVNDVFVDASVFQRKFNISFSFVSHNQFASFMLAVFWVAIAMIGCYKGHHRIILIGMVLVFGLAVILSLSRGAWVAFVGSSIFFTAVLLYKKNGLSMLTWAGVPVLLLATFFFLLNLDSSPVIDRMMTLMSAESAGRVRLLIWQDTWKYILDHVWLGTGGGTYQYVFPGYQSDELSGTFFRHAHNDYLELFAEYGLVGVALAGVFIYLLFAPAVQRIIYSKSLGNTEAMFCLGAMTACFSILLHSFFEFNFHIPANTLLFLVFAAIVLSIVEKSNESTTSDFILPRFNSVYAVKSAIVFVIVIAISVSYIEVQHQRAQELIKEARASLQQKKTDVAIETLEKAHSAAPLDYSVLSMLAGVLKSRATEMRIDYDQDAYLMEALKAIDTAINKFQYDGGLWYTKATILEALDRKQEHIDALKFAVKYLPSAFHTQYAWAKVLFESGKFYEAATHFSIALKIRPQLIDDVIIFTLSQRGDQAFLEKMFAGNAFMYLRAGNFYLDQGHVSDGLNALELALKYNHSPQQAILNLSALGNERYKGELIRKAEEYLQQWPDSHVLTNAIASYYLNFGMNKEVDRLIRSFLITHDADQKMYDILFSLYLQEGNYLAAEDLIQREINDSPDAHSYAKLSRLYHHQGETSKALDAIKSALQLTPDDPELHYQAGLLYSSLNIETFAVDHWRRCVSLPQCKKAILEIKKSIGLDSVVAEQQQ